HIEIPKDEVIRELDKAYNDLKKKAKVKGFRPGKAPRNVLERLFKNDVYADVSTKILQSSFIDAIKETNLNIVGNPRIDPPELINDKPYKYKATVEIMPEISDIDYKGLSLKKNLYKVNNEDIDTQLKMLQKSLAQQTPIEEDIPAKNGDVVLIDYEGFKDGKPFEQTGKTENFTVKIGDGRILKEFDKGLIGMKAGESKEIRVKFPKDYADNALANNEITFEVKLNEIRKEVLPEIDDEFAKKLGNYQTVDDLKNDININLEQGYTKRVEQEMNEQIFEALIAKSDFEVPESLVDNELEGIIAEAERSFAYQGKSMEELGFTKESLSEKYRGTAEKQVRRHLILGKISNQETLSLNEEEVETGFKEMSESFNYPLEEIKKFYKQDKDKFSLFKHTLLEKRAINLIIENSKIDEVKPKAKKKEEEKKKD
ncbi:MAG: trigger factor, partial [Desulfobacterales bacterium]|nr:trigger factor [Desulfobacterales bacterium]